MLLSVKEDERIIIYDGLELSERRWGMAGVQSMLRTARTQVRQFRQSAAIQRKGRGSQLHQMTAAVFLCLSFLCWFYSLPPGWHLFSFICTSFIFLIKYFKRQFRTSASCTKPKSHRLLCNFFIRTPLFWELVGVEALQFCSWVPP
jgi:hypothetical protein